MYVKVEGIVEMCIRDRIYCANDYGYDPEWLPGSNKPSATIAFGANINF